jgi:hypothetical protein
VEQRPVVVNAPQAPIEITPEKIRELLLSDKPEQGVALMLDTALRARDQNYQQRIQGVTQSAGLIAFEGAKQRHAEDFADFGEDIVAAAQQLDPATLSSPAMWDDIVSWVRGQPKNKDKWLQRELKKLDDQRKESARTTQQQRAGVTSAGSRRGSGVVSGTGSGAGDPSYGLTAEELRHAEMIGVTAKDWAEEKRRMRAERTR